MTDDLKHWPSVVARIALAGTATIIIGWAIRLITMGMAT